MLEAEGKKLLSIMSNYPYTWSELMLEPEARTSWMYEKLLESAKEQEDKWEEQANMNKFKGKR